MDETELRHVLGSLDPTTRTLIAEVDLGEQAREFIYTELGQHLVGCLKQEVVLAQGELATTFFLRVWKVKDLQNRIWRAQFMLSWLRDLLVAGKSAQSALEEAEHER